jgi:salicylate hydroxylase
MWSGSGKMLGEVARNRRPEDSLLSVTLMRADLVTALRTAAREAGATIITGHRATSNQAADADLIVGADGIWSATRRTLDPSAPEPAYSGLYSVSGTSTRPPEIARDGFNWIFARRGVFIYLPAPYGTVWWTAQVSSKQPPGDPAATDLASLFRTEPRAAAILARTTGIRAANLGYTLRPVTRRYNDRTVLIGDAAHPAGAGQGASMALEDAVILARHVADGGTIPRALAAFDRERLPRAGKMARMETRNRDAKTSGPIAARMREVIMPHVFTRFYEGATGWLYDFDLGTAHDTKTASDACP